MAGLPAAAVVQPTTYLGLYQSADDPYNDVYSPMYAGQDANGPLIQPADLFTQVMSATSTVPAVYLFHTDHGIRVIHRPLLFGHTPGIVTQFDNRYFGFLSDVPSEAGPALLTVGEWPDEAFYRTQMTTVPTVAEMFTQWAATAAAEEYIGPFVAGSQDTDTIRTRRMVAVPKPYWEIVMNRGFMSPRQLWTELGAPIVTENRGQDLTHLLDWIRVHCTFRLGANLGDDPRPPDILRPGFVILEHQLQTKVLRTIDQDLPGRRSPTGAVADLATAHLGTLQVIQNGLVQQRDLALRAAAPQTLQDKHPRATEMLMRQLEVNHFDHLTEFWREYPKRDTDVPQCLMTLFRQRLHENPNAAYLPIVTPDLVKAIKSMSFGTDGASNLKCGLSIFHVETDRSPTAAEARRRRDLLETLTAGGHATTLETAQACYASEQIVVIQTSHEGACLIKAYGVILDVIVGIYSRVALAYQVQLVQRLNEIIALIEQAYGGYGRDLKFRTAWMKMLVYIYRETNAYFRNVMTYGADAPPPNYQDILSSLMKGQFTTLTELPEEYFPTGPPGTPAPGILALGRPVLLQSSPPTGPTFVPPTPPPETPLDTPPGGLPVTNPHNRDLHAAWAASNSTLFQAPNGVFYDAATPTKKKPLPLADNGKSPLCVAWALRGKCFTNCRTGREHKSHRALTATEVARLRAAAGL